MFRTNAVGVLASLLIAAGAQAAPIATPSVKLPLDVAAKESPRASSSRLVGLTKLSSGTIVAVGQRGHILLSRDSGASWAQARVPVSSDLVAVQFPSEKVGWAVGHDGVVLKTEDGGTTWAVKLDGRRYGNLMVDYYEKSAAANTAALEAARRFQADGADKPFLDVWFENEKSGWVVGAFNLILKTDDGGASWQPWVDRTDNDKGYTLYAVRKVDGEVFVAGELGLFMRLDRERQRFVRVAIPYPGSLFGVAGRKSVLVAFGLRGNAFRSRDRGATWEKLETGLAGSLTDGAYLDDGRLVLASTAGEVAVSDDDGATFRKVAYPNPTPLSGVSQVGRETLLAVGAKGARTLSIR